MTQHVLIVEDEYALQRGVLRSLESMEGIRCTGCSTLDAAREVLDSDPPDLLLTDINLGGDNGLELITELEAGQRRIPIIIMTAYRTAYAQRIPDSELVTLLDKPLDLRQLKELVRTKLETASEIEATLEVVDYLQLAAMGRSSALLEAHLAGGEVARVEIVGGEVWTARLGELRGRQAIRQMLHSRSSSIIMKPLLHHSTEREVSEGIESLLLDMARHEDEENAGRTDDPGADAYREAFDRGIEAGMEKRWAEAAEFFREALRHRPEDAQALYNLQRVEDILRKSSASRP